MPSEFVDLLGFTLSCRRLARGRLALRSVIEVLGRSTKGRDFLFVGVLRLLLRIQQILLGLLVAFDVIWSESTNRFLIVGVSFPECLLLFNFETSELPRSALFGA